MVKKKTCLTPKKSENDGFHDGEKERERGRCFHGFQTTRNGDVMGI